MFGFNFRNIKEYEVRISYEDLMDIVKTTCGLRKEELPEAAYQSNISLEYETDSGMKTGSLKYLRISWSTHGSNNQA